MPYDEEQPLGGGDFLWKPKIIYLILLFALAGFFLSFAAINTELWQRAMIYLVLFLLGMIGWLTSKVITQKKRDEFSFPNPVIFEKRSVFFKYKRWHLVFLFLIIFNIANFIFFSISASSANALIAAPKFQVLAVTPEINFLFTIAAAMIEDFVIFALGGVIIGGLLWYLTKNEYIALSLAIFLTALLFMGYHIAVYGENIPALQSIFLFGLLGGFFILTFKNLMFSMIHIANNLALVVFTQIGIGGVNYLFWVFLILSVSLGLVFMFKGKRGETLDL